jgi:hypothetical protein
MARQPAAKLSLVRRFQQVCTGVIALAIVTAFFFAILRWRVNTPEEHLIFGKIVNDRLPGHDQ